MNLEHEILNRVRQKVKIFFSKVITKNFLATHQRKQVFASSFLTTNLKTIAINNQYIAKAYSVIADTFRRRKRPTIRRKESTICRKELAMRRKESAIQRNDSAMRRNDSAIQRKDTAIRRTEPAIWRNVPAMWRADLTKRRGTSTIHFIGVKTWFLALSF